MVVSLPSSSTSKDGVLVYMAPILSGVKTEIKGSNSNEEKQELTDDNMESLTLQVDGPITRGGGGGGGGLITGILRSARYETREVQLFLLF